MDASPIMRMTLLLGRILLAAIFLRAGFHKIFTLPATAATIAAHGLPASPLLALGATVIELGGGILLVIGWQARWAALVLFFYTLMLAVIFHPFWAVPTAQAGTQASFFFGHLSMMGGMLFVFTFGPGPASLDNIRHGVAV